ncbi:MAG: hypothetical protein VX265_06700 [Myxococcota bacterium]|nr:hypothetical protein [Myxococcota bacterium]
MRVLPIPALLWLTGCLGQILDAPFVLASGLGAARGVAPSPDRTLLVATADGVVEVGGDGTASTLVEGVDARAVATHRTRIYVLVEEGILHGSSSGAAEAFRLWPRSGIRDIQASCDEQLLYADDVGVWTWDPGSGQSARRGPPLANITSLALDPIHPCDGVLALATDAVHWVSKDAVVPIITGLRRPVALTADRWGGIWVVHDEPPVLAKLTAEGPETRARHVDATADLVFGVGELLHPANVYFVGPSGSLDYARVVLEGERLRASRPTGTPPRLGAPSPHR